MSFGKALLGGLVFGVPVAIFFCHMALADNNQGEFADVVTGSYTSNLYLLFAATASAVALPVALLLRLTKSPDQPGD